MPPVSSPTAEASCSGASASVAAAMNAPRGADLRRDHHRAAANYRQDGPVLVGGTGLRSEHDRRPGAGDRQHGRRRVHRQHRRRPASGHRQRAPVHAAGNAVTGPMTIQP